MSDTPWSYSQLSTFIRCPLKHFFKYVLGLPERSTPAPLALGHAVHEALAEYHRGLQARRPLSGDAILATFLRSWRERKARELITYPQGTEQGTLDQGVALLEAYLQTPPPEGIVAVEEQIVVPLVTSGGEILDRQLLAVLDLLTRNADGLEVTDIKTSSRAYSDMDAQTSLQATAYLYAAQEQYGEVATFRYAVLVKTKKPKVQTVETARMPTDFTRLGDLVQVIDRAVEAGVHYPVESPYNCSTCNYRKPCREWQSDQTLPAPQGRIPLPTLGGDDVA